MGTCVGAVSYTHLDVYKRQAQEFDEALMNVSKEMQRLLMRITGWDAVDTYMYMSVQSDVELSQACKPCEVQLSLRMGTPKLPQFPPLVPQP